MKKLFTILLIVFSIACAGQGKRYVKVVERRTLQPLDSFVVSVYHVSGNDVVFLSEGISDRNGLVKISEPWGDNDRINAQQLRTGFKYWPGVENTNGFKGDTFVVKVDMATIRRIRYENVYFAFGSDSLLDFYKEKMESFLPDFIKMLDENQAYKIEVSGHIDNKEAADSTNTDLSQKRADRVKAYLISKGINKDNIIAKALSSSTPLVPNEKNGEDDPEGRAQNRRVEFHIVTE